MLNLVDSLVQLMLKKASGFNVSEDPYTHGFNVRLAVKDERVLRAVLTEQIHEEFSGELEKYEKLAEEIRVWNVEKAVLRAELERDRKVMEMDFAVSRNTLEQAIKLETDEDKKRAMQVAVENVSLREKITYLESELKFYREMAKDSSSAVNETLKTAFTKQPSVTINN